MDGAGILPDHKPAKEPSGSRSHPPSGQEPDQPHEKAIRPAEIGPGKLQKLEFREVFRRKGKGDLIMQDTVETRCQSPLESGFEQRKDGAGGQLGIEKVRGNVSGYRFSESWGEEKLMIS